MKQLCFVILLLWLQASILQAQTPANTCSETSPTWVSTTTYTSGQCVLLTGICYCAKSNVPVGTRPATTGTGATYWTQQSFATTCATATNWVSALSYPLNSMVLWEGCCYKATAKTTNQIPNEFSNPWAKQDAACGCDLFCDLPWNNYQIYQACQMAYYTDGLCYKAKQRSTNNIPNVANSGFWELVGPSPVPINLNAKCESAVAYDATKTYTLGQVILYNCCCYWWGGSLAITTATATLAKYQILCYKEDTTCNAVFVATQPYAVCRRVCYEGKCYKALVNVPANSLIPPSNAAMWSGIGACPTSYDRCKDAPLYKEGGQYAAGTVVAKDCCCFISLVATTVAPSSSVPTVWQQVVCYSQTPTCDTAWSSTTAYTYCAGACLNGICYKAQIGNTGLNPSTNPTTWAVNGVCKIDSGKCFNAAPYNPANVYQPGTYVSFKCCCFVATAVNPAGNTPNPNPPYNNGWYGILCYANTYQNCDTQWSSTVQYTYCDKVCHTDGICYTSNFPNTNLAPPTDATSWTASGKCAIVTQNDCSNAQPWDPTVSYPAGTYVSFDCCCFKNEKDSKGVKPQNVFPWVNEWIGILCYLSKYKCSNGDVWSSTVKYSYCDSVCHKGVCYTSKFPNVNDAPLSANWDKTGICGFDSKNCFNALPYVPGTTYPAGTYVAYKCCCFVSVVDTKAEPDPYANYDIWFGILCYKSNFLDCSNTWDPTVKYTYCDHACYRGVCYQVIYPPTINVSPDTLPASWEKTGICKFDTSQCFDALPYVPGQIYAPGTYVSFGCCCFVAVEKTDQQPNPNGVASPFSKDPWYGILCYKSNFPDCSTTWDSNIKYTYCDKVCYQGICYSTNFPNVGVDPTDILVNPQPWTAVDKCQSKNPCENAIPAEYASSAAFSPNGASGIYVIRDCCCYLLPVKYVTQTSDTGVVTQTYSYGQAVQIECYKPPQYNCGKDKWSPLVQYKPCDCVCYENKCYCSKVWNQQLDPYHGMMAFIPTWEQKGECKNPCQDAPLAQDWTPSTPPQQFNYVIRDCCCWLIEIKVNADGTQTIVPAIKVECYGDIAIGNPLVKFSSLDQSFARPILDAPKLSTCGNPWQSTNLYQPCVRACNNGLCYQSTKWTINQVPPTFPTVWTPVAVKCGHPCDNAVPVEDFKPVAPYDQFYYVIKGCCCYRVEIKDVANGVIYYGETVLIGCNEQPKYDCSTPWSNTIQYKPCDQACFNGKCFKAKVVTINDQPDISPVKWDPSPNQCKNPCESAPYFDKPITDFIVTAPVQPFYWIIKDCCCWKIEFINLDTAPTWLEPVQVECYGDVAGTCNQDPWDATIAYKPCQCFCFKGIWYKTNTFLSIGQIPSSLPADQITVLGDCQVVDPPTDPCATAQPYNEDVQYDVGTYVIKGCCCLVAVKSDVTGQVSLSWQIVTCYTPQSTCNDAWSPFLTYHPCDAVCFKGQCFQANTVIAANPNFDSTQWIPTKRACNSCLNAVPKDEYKPYPVPTSPAVQYQYIIDGCCCYAIVTQYWYQVSDTGVVVENPTPKDASATPINTKIDVAKGILIGQTFIPVLIDCYTENGEVAIDQCSIPWNPNTLYKPCQCACYNGRCFCNDRFSVNQIPIQYPNVWDYKQECSKSGCDSAVEFNAANLPYANQFVIYKCYCFYTSQASVAPNLSGNPWTMIQQYTANFNCKHAWSPQIKYNPCDSICYRGVCYASNSNNLNAQPDVSPSDWTSTQKKCDPCKANIITPTTGGTVDINNDVLLTAESLNQNARDIDEAIIAGIDVGQVIKKPWYITYFVKDCCCYQRLLLLTPTGYVEYIQQIDCYVGTHTCANDVWDFSTPYQFCDKVCFKGICYTATSPNTGVVPPSGLTAWAPSANDQCQQTNPCDDAQPWDPTIKYPPGTYVIFECCCFVARDWVAEINPLNGLVKLWEKVDCYDKKYDCTTPWDASITYSPCDQACYNGKCFKALVVNSAVIPYDINVWQGVGECPTNDDPCLKAQPYDPVNPPQPGQYFIRKCCCFRVLDTGAYQQIFCNTQPKTCATPWQNNVQYYPCDQACYKTKCFEATAANYNANPTVYPALWSLFSNQCFSQGGTSCDNALPWSATFTYPVGTYVIYKECCYVNVDISFGYSPGTYYNLWHKVDPNCNRDKDCSDVWLSTSIYQIYDLVCWNGKCYEAQSPNTGYQPQLYPTIWNSVGPCQPQTQGCGASWEFSETITATQYTDNMGSVNNWLYQIGAVQTDNGVLELNGGYAKAAHDVEIDFGKTQDFSIATWYKSTDKYQPNPWKYIVDKSIPVGTSWKGYHLKIAKGMVICEIADGTSVYVVNSNKILFDNDWHCIVCSVKKGVQMQLFIDGVLDNTATIPTLDTSNGNSLIVGMNYQGQNSLNFQLDRLRIVCFAMTADDVKKYCSQTQPGCGAIWSFSEFVSPNNDVLGFNDLGYQQPPIFSNGVLNLKGGYDKVADSSNLNFAVGQDFTFMAWIRTTEKFNRVPVFQKKGTSSQFQGYDFWVTPTDAFIILNDQVLLVSYPFVTSSLTLNNGNWHHVAFTFVPGVVNGAKFYYNGAFLQQSNTVSIVPTLANTDVLTIGYDPPSNSQFFGQLDEVKILCRALRADEIKKIYATESPAKAILVATDLDPVLVDTVGTCRNC